MVMNRHNFLANFGLFALGLGITARVFIFVGTMIVSDILSILFMPFLFLRLFKEMKKEGFVIYIYMCLSLILGLIFSSIYNGETFADLYKAVISYIGLISYFLVFYATLRNNPRGLGWFFFGYALSGIITIWFFNAAVLESQTLPGMRYFGNKTVEEVMNDSLFWVGRISSIGQLPIIASYLKTPLMYSVSYPILFVIAALLLTISGRGQSASILISGALISLCGKSRRKMLRIKRHFVLMLIVVLVAVISYKFCYSYLASHGVLGADAQAKYEGQTARGTDAISVLLSSRAYVFMGLYAAIHHPLVGFGSNNIDKEDFSLQYAMKYGVDEDVRNQVFFNAQALKYGYMRRIPTHSHIIGAWVSCGLIGLVFFIWYLVLLFKHVMNYLAVVPQWFGYFAISVPSILFSIFFSPMRSRWDIALFAFCALYARAIARGRIVLPYDMEKEARKYE